MFPAKIKILNFDDSLTEQKALLSAYGPEIINLTDVGPRARFWLDKAEKDKLKKSGLFAPEEAIVFLGSNDFHHISSILISGLNKKVSVICFDRHPDWGVFLTYLTCGSWVADAMKAPNVAKMIHLGMHNERSFGFSIVAGDFSLLRDDRLEIYPYSQRRTNIFLKRIPKNISVFAKNGLLFSRIKWREFKKENPALFMKRIVDRLPVRDVYVSVDKDCLKRQYALTNWEEGGMDIRDLIGMLKVIEENARMVGCDICGDYSEVKVKGFFRKVISTINHPRSFTAGKTARDVINRINEETNMLLLQTLAGS